MGLFQHLASNWDDVLAGATFWGIIAHAVNQFPTPNNRYGSWLLGVIQFAVGQRVVGVNTFKGEDTLTSGVSKDSILKP